MGEDGNGMPDKGVRTHRGRHLGRKCSPPTRDTAPPKGLQAESKETRHRPQAPIEVTKGEAAMEAVVLEPSMLPPQAQSLLPHA